MPSPSDVAGTVFLSPRLGLWGVMWQGREIVGRWNTEADAAAHLEKLRAGLVEPRYFESWY